MSSQNVQKISLLALTTMVVGSMVGAGIFSLPQRFGAVTGPVGAVIAWVVAAGGHLLREGQVVAPVDRSNRPLKLAAGGGAAAIATRSE